MNTEDYSWRPELLPNNTPSKWKCYLFGGTKFQGYMWRPLEGQEPNAFWRWMQYICFGNRWEKDQ